MLRQPWTIAMLNIKKRKLPYYYEVRFRLIAYDSENNYNFSTHSKKCVSENLLEARNDAFELFEEYLTFLEQGERLKKNTRGNFIIIKPPFVNKMIKNVEPDMSKIDDESYFDSIVSQIGKRQQTIEKFREEISIFLIVEDDSIYRKIYPDSHNSYTEEHNWEIEIHKVSSADYTEQVIIDHLEFDELALYNYLEIDASDKIKKASHFGEDFGDSGEEEGSEIRTIIETPHIWQSLKEYRELYSIEEVFGENVEEEEKESLSYEEIILKGEGHQIEFKPAILYNFRTGKPGISVKNIIAKTICSFLNSDGGILFVGVKDDKSIQGLHYDYSLFPGMDAQDKVKLELDELISQFIGISTSALINSSIEQIENKDVLVIIVNKSKAPVFLKKKINDNVVKEFYIRSSGSHQLRDVEDIIKYIFHKNWTE